VVALSLLAEAVAEAGGAATVSGGLVRSPRCSFSLCFFRFFLFFSGWFFLSSRSSSLFFVPLSSFSLLRSTSSSLSPLFFRFFFSPSLLCFFSFFFSLPFLLFSQRSWPLFIEAKDVVFYSSHGGQPAGRPLGAAAEVRWVVRGGWSAIVSGRWAPGESGRQKFKKKQPFFPSSPLRDRGEEDEQCRSKRHRSSHIFFFFFFECMKRRRFGENAPFHLNVAPKRAKFQISPQSSFLSSIASLPISVFVPLVGRVFHFSPWPLIYAIEPLIDQKTSNFFN
jgi:hypothetical protein